MGIISSGSTAYEKVKAARASNRPTSSSYLSNIFSDFIGAAR